MSFEPEAFIAEFDESAPRLSSPSASDEEWGTYMNFDIEEEIKNRRTAIQQIIDAGPKHVEASVDAYNRDLPKLLHDHLERHVVAYEGSRRVGIAKSREELVTKLDRDGIDQKNCFIKFIMPLDDKSEHFQKRSNY